MKSERVRGSMESSMGTPDGRCIACKGELQSIGTEQFRVGGTTGGWKLLFGEWAELGEDMLSFEVLACTACRRVELRAPPAGTLKHLFREARWAARWVLQVRMTATA